jgi:hypothetical protein
MKKIKHQNRETNNHELVFASIHEIHNINDLQMFVFQKTMQYGKVEYSVNNSLRFGIGENAYTTTEEAFKAKEKEPIAILNLFNGFHIVSADTVIFFFYWLLERDEHLTISDGKQSKIVIQTQTIINQRQSIRPQNQKI